MEKLCDTCLYGMRVEDNKLACTYAGVCHTPDGEKTAWAPNKTLQYADLKGRRFRPTFASAIDYFEIRGYDAERDMVLTVVHPKEGTAFDDEIEERYLMGAFETGEYKPIEDNLYLGGEQTFMLHNYYMPPSPHPRQQKFCGPCCTRCQHRFGKTYNRQWCESHQHSEKCYRFKLEK